MAETKTAEEEAIAKAATDLTHITYVASDFTKVKSPTGSESYRFYGLKPKRGDARPNFERQVRLKDVMFPLGEGHFVPGYYMELWIKGFPAFSYVMDAIDTPDLLYRRKLTQAVAFKYRVHNTGNGIFNQRTVLRLALTPDRRAKRLQHRQLHKSLSRSKAYSRASPGFPKRKDNQR
jgi:hypothetical protein